MRRVLIAAALVLLFAQPAQAQLKAGMVAFYPMSADTNDVHGTNHLTNNGVTFPGGFADFELGEGDYASVADNAALSITGDLTLCGNVQLESKTDYMILAGKDNVTSRSYVLYYDQGLDQFGFFVTPDGTTVTAVYATTFGSPSTSTPYFICGRLNTTTDLLKISVNAGTVDTQAYASGIVNDASPFAIGANFNAGTPGTFWDGIIVKVMLFNVDKTDAEITTIYNGGAVLNYGQLDSPGTLMLTGAGH